MRNHCHRRRCGTNSHASTLPVSDDIAATALKGNVTQTCGAVFWSGQTVGIRVAKLLVAHEFPRTQLVTYIISLKQTHRHRLVGTGLDPGKKNLKMNLLKVAQAMVGWRAL